MHLEKNQSALFDNSRRSGYCLQFSEKRFQLWSHSGRFERNGWRAVPEGRPALGHDAERRVTVLCGDDHLYLGGSRRSCDETSADNDTSSRPRTDLTGRLHPRAALCAHGRGMRSPFPPSGGSSADPLASEYRPEAKTQSLTSLPEIHLEVTPGFEPGNQGFADPCLTTWLCHRLWSYYMRPAGKIPDPAQIFLGTRMPTHSCGHSDLERATRLELATSTLARWRSTR